MKHWHLKASLICAVLYSTLGCSPTIRRPQLYHPGPAGFQRQNATQFDPYPPNDVAPEIVGGRPRGYQKPPNEVERARQHSLLQLWRNSPRY